MGKTFDPGSHNRLQKAILEEFTPRFAPGSECLYVGDTTHRDVVNLLTPQPRPTNTPNQRLPANQGLLTPQLTPVWKPSYACLSSCKASLFCIRFICLNRSVLHSLPLSSPIPVAAGSSSQHRKKNLSAATFFSCGDERSGQRTSRGLKKPPLADSGGSGSDKDPCVILQPSGNGGAAIICCKMEEKGREIKFFKLKTSKRFCKPKYFP